MYIDSPLATEATRIFRDTDPDCFDAQTRALLEKGIDPINVPGLRISVTSDDSRMINTDRTPKVILSASGMCEAGRIRHHLKHNLWRPECTILFVGYQAVGTLGRTLIEGHNTELLHRYVLAMALELKANAADLADCEVQAIRLGGGSASIINGSDLDHLLRLIRSCYHVAEDAPVTMRTCPADINGANMPFYNRSHFTRYDLELYSLEPLDFCTLDTLNLSLIHI